MILDYIIVEATNTETLLRRVRERISLGYQPHGSLIYLQCTDNDNSAYVQAMVLDSASQAQLRLMKDSERHCKQGGAQ